jgi:hypothetical protein
MFTKVASTEPNVKLQDCLFRCASTFAELDNYLSSYSQCEEDTKVLIDEAKLYLVTPLRVSMNLRLYESLYFYVLTIYV